MKICMYSVTSIASKNTGGVRRYWELMNCFIKNGHSVTVFSPDDFNAMEIQGVTFISFNVNKKESFIGIRTLIGNSHIFKKIKEENFDKVIVFDINAAFSLAINKIKNIQLFLRQDMIKYKSIQLADKNKSLIYKNIYLKILKYIERICLLKADKIIIQCKFDLNEILIRHYKYREEILKKSIIQINNINPSWVVDTESRYHYEVSNKVYDIVFIGNFRDSRKGHDLLLEAVSEITKDGKLIKTAIIGDGNQLNYYKEKYSTLENISFLGRVDTPYEVLLKSKLLVVPSYVDSCPNTVLEGLYFKIPVIGANSSGIPEILNDKEWLFDLNKEALKRAMLSSLECGNNKKIINNQNVRRKELMFDWGEKMLSIIEG